MQNIVGQIASKENFYIRKKEIKRIERNLRAGANIQLAAPRRVGKSSILHYFKDNPIKGFVFIYVDVEAARNKQEFYRKLYKEVIRNEELNNTKNLWKQIQEGANKFFKKLKNLKVEGVGEITLNDEQEVEYEEELLNLLQGIDLGGEKLVIMIDEFPEVLLNMVEDSKGDITAARSFLQSNRAFRNDDGIKEKVQFIYTGSNSLNVTAASLGSTELINDIPATPVDPLSNEEAKDLVIQVLEEYDYKIDPAQLDYIIARVEWSIPFYFQLLIQEIINAIEPEDSITDELIDECLVRIADQRNDHHFEHYVKRLKRVFVEDRRVFTMKFLNALCQVDSMTRDEAINLAHGIIGEDVARRVIGSLVYDGYIVQIYHEPVTYKFNSPILKRWWYNHEC